MATFSSSRSEVSPPPMPGFPSLNNTFGALLLGCFAGLIMYGILVQQAYKYFRVYSDDQRINKVFVISILAMDTLRNIVFMHLWYAVPPSHRTVRAFRDASDSYTYLVSDYFKPLALLRGQYGYSVKFLAPSLEVIHSTLAGSSRHERPNSPDLPVVSGLYDPLLCPALIRWSNRVLCSPSIHSTKHRVAVALSVILMLTTLGFAIAGTVIAFKPEVDTFALYERYYWIDSVALGTAVAADSLTAGTLIVYLFRLLTGYEFGPIVNALAIVLAVIMPNTMIWIAIEFVGFRLYANSVLAVLNSRRSLREAADRLGINRPTDLELGLRSAQKPDTDERIQSGSGGTPSKPTLVGWPSDTVIDISV
ncbi:hypothetical protein OH76DRAFT_1487891 [Lentinus brumalis]|uniref:DUF6534 domain-containing protein n=1 Tax=Lentinus brumalis TaxID=2498619 RepID=A0A371CT01_9APHY|nr:hypothetical protein OH76DRAFT_1487891 [Polyporus brumalis]